MPRAHRQARTDRRRSGGPTSAREKVVGGRQRRRLTARATTSATVFATSLGARITAPIGYVRSRSTRRVWAEIRPSVAQQPDGRYGQSCAE